MKEKYTFHGFCIYVTIGEETIGFPLDSQMIENLIWKCIMTDEQKKQEMLKLKKELIRKFKNGELSVDEEMDLLYAYPYYGGHCGYGYEDQCIMCENGCDFM